MIHNILMKKKTLTILFIVSLLCLLAAEFFKINVQKELLHRYRQIGNNKTIVESQQESTSNCHFLYKNADYEKEAKDLENMPIIKVFYPGRDEEKEADTMTKFADFFENSILSEMIEANEIVSKKEIIRRKKIIEEESWAVEFDLNNDKENEIIGYRWDMCGTIMCPLYILQKQADGKYLNISDSDTIPYVYQLNILKSYKNGFHDIGIISGGPGNGFQGAIRFDENN